MAKEVVEALSEHYRQVAELVNMLIAETRADRIRWTYRGPLAFVEAEHNGFRYILENPQDGQPEFVVGDVLVWRGYQLRELWTAAMAQDRRLRPPTQMPGPTCPPTSSAGRRP